MDPIDPTTNQQIEEFHHRLDRMAFMYKKAVVMMAADRLMRDLDTLPDPPLFRSGVLPFVARLLSRPVRWIQKGPLRKRDEVQHRPTVTIIDPEAR